MLGAIGKIVVDIKSFTDTPSRRSSSISLPTPCAIDFAPCHHARIGIRFEVLSFSEVEERKIYGAKARRRGGALQVRLHHPAHDREENGRSRSSSISPLKTCGISGSSGAAFGNISESTLSKQLRELVDDGFLVRTDFREVPPRVEYTLTPQGESFVPILLSMKQWGEKELRL